jgi:hypothetical protein
MIKQRKKAKNERQEEGENEINKEKKEERRTVALLVISFVREFSVVTPLTVHGDTVSSKGR